MRTPDSREAVVTKRFSPYFSDFGLSAVTQLEGSLRDIGRVEEVGVNLSYLIRTFDKSPYREELARAPQEVRDEIAGLKDSADKRLRRTGINPAIYLR